jgi:hypothetical protein
MMQSEQSLILLDTVVIVQVIGDNTGKNAVQDGWSHWETDEDWETDDSSGGGYDDDDDDLN